MPRRSVPPRDPRPLVQVLAALTTTAVVYLTVAGGCHREPTRHEPDGSCRDRVVYQAARLSDC